MLLELSVLLRLFSIGSSKKECGISHFEHRDVPGRVLANPNSWPWVASLLYQNDSGRKLNVLEYFMLNYELCLGEFIQPICLPNYDDDFRDDGSLGYVAGWGENSNVLRQAQVHVISNGVCKTFFTVEILCITFACIPEENQVCTHPSATYDGESGGPLMIRRTYQRGNETIRRWFFFGVISFQKPAAGPGSIQIILYSLNEDVYTRVVPHCKWFEEKTKSAVQCIFGD